MFTKLVAGSLLAATSLWGAMAAAGQKASDCCSQQLACCTKPAACCAAAEKLACCQKGQKCCSENRACCRTAQACCLSGAACCDKAQACCGPAAAPSDPGNHLAANTSPPACCSVKSTKLGLAKAENCCVKNAVESK